MRRNKDGMLKTIDTPTCCQCKKDLDLDCADFQEISVEHMSGAVREVFCQHCGHYQHVCPSIEWQTWDA